MTDFHLHNSYESTSGSSTSSSTGSALHDPLFVKSGHFDEVDTLTITNLLMPQQQPAGTELDEYTNTSVDDRIFPNQLCHQPSSGIPSYEPEYDYYNLYSTAPLVYSWMPIVPEFNPNSTGNLHNFQHIVEKMQPKPLDISSQNNECFDCSLDSAVVSNQDSKFKEYLAINKKVTEKIIMPPNQSEIEFYQLDNSCNAMDLDISQTTASISNEDNTNLSFNGKVSSLQRESCARIEESSVDQNELFDREHDEAEDERLHNESFEMLRKEDSSKMLYINERSPELFGDDDYEPPSCDEPDETPIISTKDYVNVSENCDSAILNKLRTSLTGICPPPSVTRYQLSLSEMLSAYQHNVNAILPTYSKVQSSSFFTPSHSFDAIKSMKWPAVASVRFHDIHYNKSTISEDIEILCLKYGERYVGAEFSSSFNNKIGPSSARKRNDRLKLIAQSPGSRLSHLAKRRSIFSSANLKSTLSSSLIGASRSSSATIKPLLVDKKKLYQKSKAKSPKKRTVSAKKKTPGKRKTPKSSKRKNFNPAAFETVNLPRASSKRALFTSPSESLQNSEMLIVTTNEIPKRVELSKRTLFLPTNDSSKKRHRSPSPDRDVENHVGKSRRLESPTIFTKSQSFSMTSTTGTVENFKKKLFYRTQSEVVTQQHSKAPSMGYRQPMNDEIKKKLLWAASSSLASKQISNDHAKFKEFATLLVRLVKKVFTEFFIHGKSISNQMIKFANQMVYYVIQGQTFEEIYLVTKSRLQSNIAASKVSGYIAQENYEHKPNLVGRKCSSLLLMPHSQSCSSLSISQQSSEGILDLSVNDGSNSSLNRSSSKNNGSTLRENFFRSGDNANSARKCSTLSDTDLSKMSSNSSLGCNVMKAKRQISF